MGIPIFGLTNVIWVTKLYIYGSLNKLYIYGLYYYKKKSSFRENIVVQANNTIAITERKNIFKQ